MFLKFKFFRELIAMELTKLINIYSMDKLQLTGQNLCRVFYFRYGSGHDVHFLCWGVKLPNLKLKTRPEQVLGSLLLDIALPGYSYTMLQVLRNSQMGPIR